MNLPANWNQIYDSLSEKGFGTLPGLLTRETCLQLQESYDRQDLFRSTINMERYRFGKGEYKYFDYPLPEAIAMLRQFLYPPLSSIANQWMSQLSINQTFPAEHDALVRQCHNKKQIRPTPLILRYEKGGHNTLHQDLYGEIYFPLQVVIALSQPGKDYEGGAFVLTTQLPRAQSKVQVLNMNQGDGIVFTTRFRPVKGTRGFYRANVKHGVSEISEGVRYSLGIIFHDGL